MRDQQGFQRESYISRTNNQGSIVWLSSSTKEVTMRPVPTDVLKLPVPKFISESEEFGSNKNFVQKLQTQQSSCVGKGNLFYK